MHLVQSMQLMMTDTTWTRVRRPMRHWLFGAVVFGGACAGGVAMAQAESPERSVRAHASEPSPAGEHPVPRLKISLEGFSVDTPLGTSVALTGAHAEMYPLSRRWLRAGVGLSGGNGHGAVAGGSATVEYGMMGASVGAQYPGRVTPFVEGHLAGGFMAASIDHPITVNGVRVDNASGTTWLVGRGLDAGVEVYALGRAYVSGSIGWMRATWGSPDTRAIVAGTSTEIHFVDVTSDSLLWKLGIGI
jgi:hypothetical protein